MQSVSTSALRHKPRSASTAAGTTSPAVLEPAGAWLTATTRAKAASDQLLERWWGTMGLPTRRDQERTLHTLHELESKLLELQERLDEVK
jgi:hypothetical protein